MRTAFFQAPFVPVLAKTFSLQAHDIWHGARSLLGIPPLRGYIDD